MKSSDWKERLGIVYSTIPDFRFPEEEKGETETLPPGKQNLKVFTDRKSRNGKTVTLVKGFAGTENDLQELGRMLKLKCGTGGTVKDGEILIQGDVAARVTAVLVENGYKARKV